MTIGAAMRIGLLSLVVGLALAASLPAAHAQMFTGARPPQPLALPTLADPAAVARPPPPTPQPMAPTPAAASPAVAAAPAVMAASSAPLRRLPAGLTGFRLAGEIATVEWPVFLTAAQAGDKIRFKLGYLSAVSDAPEASTLSISLNGIQIGETRLEAPSAVRTLEFDVPASTAVPGFNALRLTARQRHRVDCSLDATYELWTQIDPAQTGFVFGAAGVDDVANLAAVAPEVGGAIAVRVVVAGRLSPAQMRRAFRAAQAVALAGRFQQPIVDFGPPGKAGGGIDLVVGTQDKLLEQHLLELPTASLGPRLLVRPANETRRTTLVLTGYSETDVDQAVAQLQASAAAKPEGSASGLRALVAASGLRVSGGERIRLGDLGVASQEFAGRYFRVGFDIVMPADFLPADYAKAMLDLAGGYAPGLAPGAQVLVHINGKSVASLRLPKASGDVFTQNQIALPLGYWQPGVNRIEISAQLPTAADATCDTLAPASAEKRFLFLDSTTLVMPKFARVGHLPELAATMGGGLPFADRDNPKIFVPVPDRESIGAAATLAARLAIAAGRPIDFDFATKPPVVGSGATLVVAPARALDVGLMKAVGLDPSVVRAAWEERAKLSVGGQAGPTVGTSVPDLRQNRPAACRLPAWTGPAGGSADAGTAEKQKAVAAATPVAVVDETSLYDKWNEDLAARSSWLHRARDVVSTAVGWTVGSAKSSAKWAADAFNGESPREVVNANASLAIAQNALGSSLDDVITIVTAPNAAQLSASVACLTDPRVWTRIGGRLAAVDASDGTVTSVAAATVHYVPTSPLSFENVRLIVAGWFSNNPLFYVVMILLTAGCLGLTTTNVVRNVGRRQS